MAQENKIRILVEAEVDRAIKRLKETGEVSDAAAKKGAKGFKAFKTSVVAFGAALASSAVLGAFGKFIKQAAEFDKLKVSFETFLGSAEKAKKVLRDLEKFNIATPFNVNQVNQAGKALLAFGITSDKLVGTLRNVGDVAAATGKDFNELAVIYGKAKTQGTLFAEDINQLTEAGVPIIAEFAKQLGVTEGEVKKLGSQGKISFSNLEQAFKDMTGEGGQFFDLMNKQSKTFSGRLSTLQGNMQIVGRSIGQALIPLVEDWVELSTKITGSDKALNTFKKSLVVVVAVFRVLAASAKTTFRIILAPIEVVIRTLMRLKSIVDAIDGDWKNLGKVGKEAFSGLLDELKNVGTGIANDFTDPITDAIDQMKGLNKELESAKGNLDSMGDAATGAGVKTKEMIDLEKEGTALLGEKKKEAAQAAFQASREITANAFEHRIQDLEAEKKAIDDKVKAGIISEEDGAKQMAALDKKIASEKRKQAIADKTFAITEVAIATAVGIANIWKRFGSIPPLAASLSGVVGSIGAVQTAAIASRPIPAFAMGTGSAPGGDALVGEAGPERVSLAPGSIVEPNHELLAKAASTTTNNTENIDNRNIVMNIQPTNYQDFVREAQEQLGVNAFS